MTAPHARSARQRTGRVAVPVGTALLSAVLFGCVAPLPPVAALRPAEAPMVTGQSPGSPFAEGSKEAPFSSANSYPPGAANPSARVP